MNLDYEERYGEHVGFCRIHRQRVLGTCALCEDDAHEEASCDYCGREYACDCESPIGDHMCPQCDLAAEETKIPSLKS